MFANFRIATCGIIVIASIVGCNKDSSVPPTKPAESSTESKTPSGAANSGKRQIALGKPDVTLDAATLSDEYKKDAAATLKKYQGKVLEVNGEVDEVTHHPVGQQGSIFLRGNQNLIHAVTKDPKPWLTVAKGSMIKVKGKVSVSGGGLFLELIEAEVADPGPKPVFLSVEQLAKELESDRSATIEKYQEKQVNLEGTVQQKSTGMFCPYLIQLKAPGAWTLNCCIEKAESTTVLDYAKPGQKLKVKGILRFGDEKDGKTVELVGCSLTELR